MKLLLSFQGFYLQKKEGKEQISGVISFCLHLHYLALFPLILVLAGVVEDGQRARGKKRRRLYKSESEGFSSPPPPQLQPKTHSDIRRPLEAKPFPVGIRTIGSFHGAMTNSRLNEHLFQASFTSKQEAEKVNRVKTVVHGNIAAFRQQKPAHCSPTAARGRRRANSSPVFSPLVVGGENYNLASPSVRIRADERVSVQFNRFHHPTGWVWKVFLKILYKAQPCMIFCHIYKLFFVMSPPSLLISSCLCFPSLK